ncbi:uncharacterized protein LOC125192554 isoform X3 [Salvia hispanica]|uniref:uncharacterized protein LOC125192554 isoform X3 n=1 Tax=Salvia hispanica TaxID=49212 RepID=UPI002008F686|nr:uncharacterized protein LOC125192554 isoform X3 [Salvia hispanica]
MVQEPELEQGETCYYSDPDVALSYIGEKVQSILGHLQKDFEGGVCAENLDYLLHTAALFLQVILTVGGLFLLHFKFCSTVGDGLMQGQNLVGMVLFYPLINGLLQFGRSQNLHKEFKIPTCLDLLIPVREGNSQDESDELLLETRETLTASPAYMLEMMTSFPTSDGILLSPLCKDLLNLTRERECKLESEYTVAPRNSAMLIKILNNDVLGGKKTKAVDDKWKDNRDYRDGCEQKILHGDILECKSLPDKVKSLDNNTLNNKRGKVKMGKTGELVLVIRSRMSPSNTLLARVMASVRN